MSVERDEVISGPTYKVTLGDGSRMYITVNEQAGKPFEVFVRYDDPNLYEWIALATVLITRLLRAGESLEAIGRELQEIHSPTSGHVIPGGREYSPSMVARIGRVFEGHGESTPAARAA